jgi:YD repeat-containing protein
MPPGKRRQSNAMLYTLITFVALFLIATTVAVIYYVKAEELRTKRAEAQDNLNKMASVDEVRRIGEIVGDRAPGKSYLGTTIDYLDEVVGLVTGRPVQATTAQVKASSVSSAMRPLLARAQTYIDMPGSNPADANAPGETTPEPNQVVITTVMTRLLNTLDETTKDRDNQKELLASLQHQYDNDTAAWGKTKEDLNASVDEFRQNLDARIAEYDQLTSDANQASEEVKQMYDAQGKVQSNRIAELASELGRTQHELDLAQERLKDALAQVNKVRPTPDRRVVAQQPDGKVILVDEAAGIIHINLGSTDHVYPGLTFSVYDGSSGIPSDGVGKAEVEVFSIDTKTSTARILPPVDYERAMVDLYKTFADANATTLGNIMAVVDAPLDERTVAFEEIAKGSPEKLRVLTQLAIAAQQRRNRSPIAVNDTVANLIWDKGAAHQFVIAGDFDLNADGKPDDDAIERIGALIEKWGGVVSETVTAKTDYVVLGDAPKVPADPTLADPTSVGRYETAQRRLDRYEQVRRQADSLYIPVFSYERFLYFAGYKVESAQPGAF